MDFSDEPYVRKYTRKTVTNRLLGWEGRAVLDAMLGEFDAAGVFDFRGDPVRSISAVTEIPADIVRVGLERLVETETWLVKSSRIVWPTYEEAQNCGRNDRQRQRESRKARAAKAAGTVTERPAAPAAMLPPPEQESAPPVTANAPPVTDVTAGHSESRFVTLPPSAPSHPPSHAPQERAERARPRPEPQVVDSGGVTSIPDDWVVTDALYGEAWLAGVDRPTLDEEVRYWRNRAALPAAFRSVDAFLQTRFPLLARRRETPPFRKARDNPAEARQRRLDDRMQQLRQQELAEARQLAAEPRAIAALPAGGAALGGGT